MIKLEASSYGYKYISGVHYLSIIVKNSATDIEHQWYQIAHYGLFERYIISADLFDFIEANKYNMTRLETNETIKRHDLSSHLVEEFAELIFNIESPYYHTNELYNYIKNDVNGSLGGIMS